MSFTNDFPYTDFHELNLDWVLNKIKDLTNNFVELKKQNENLSSDFDILQKNFDELRVYVESQFTDENIRKIIEKYLSTMIFIEISKNGYIIYNIPEQWSDIIFNTNGIDYFLEDVNFGTLILSY